MIINQINNFKKKTQSTKKLNALNSQNYISKKSTIGAIISEIETPENSENEDSTTTPKQKIRNKDVSIAFIYLI